MSQIEICFNKANQKLIINGRKAGYQDYIGAFKKCNYNYGLGKYKKLTMYEIKNSSKAKEEMKSHLEKATKLKLPCDC